MLAPPGPPSCERYGELDMQGRETGHGMNKTGDNVARRRGISREAQDEFLVLSQARTVAA